jgi:hypothetical protein
MNLTTVSLAVASVAAIVTVVSNAFGILDKLASAWRWVRHRAHRSDSPKIPGKTVIVLVESRINALYWGYATTGAVPGMQVVGDFHVTNISSGPVRLLDSVLRFRRRWWNRMPKLVHTHPAVKDLGSVYSGQYEIPPNATTRVRVGFVYGEPERPQPGDFVADVALVDQFGNHHWLRRLRFKHPEKMQV